MILPTERVDGSAIDQLRDAVDREAIALDGLDEAILGHGSQFPNEQVVVYSAQRIIKILMRDGMTLDEALQYFEFNIEQLHAGHLTPIIVWEIED